MDHLKPFTRRCPHCGTAADKETDHNLHYSQFFALAIHSKVYQTPSPYALLLNSLVILFNLEWGTVAIYENFYSKGDKNVGARITPSIAV